jgi:hypothetical protein
MMTKKSEINIENSMMNNNNNNNMKKFGKFPGRLMLIWFIFTFVIFGFFIFMTSSIFKSTRNSFDDLTKKAKCSSFITSYQGTNDKTDVINLIDDIIKNNNQYKANNEMAVLISVNYDNVITADYDKLINIKRNLQDKTYEVNIEYDKNGCAETVSINE